MAANESDVQKILRSSHPWTKAENAAGFVLRYLSAMRGQLIDTLGSEQASDHALTLLIGHLVSKGYGSHGKGRLRDFLIRGIRSATKVTVEKLPESQRPEVDLNSLDGESETWHAHWRECLLQLAWRSMEQRQHKHPERLHYTVLHAASSNPDANATMLAVQVSAAAGVAVDPERVAEILPESRKQFAEILATEVANTLEDPTAASIAAELKALGLRPTSKNPPPLP